MASNAPAAKRRLCINCDNRHGCRSEQPACLTLRLTEAERRLSGQRLMVRRGLLGQCAACALFRRCWNGEAYRRQLELELEPSPQRRPRARRGPRPRGGGDR